MTEYAEVEIVRQFDPVTLPSDATVMMAARHMHTRHVSAVLITDEHGRLVGIFTERDAISRVLADGRDPAATTLAEVMTDNPNTVPPEGSTEEIVRVMRDAHCRHLPIVEAGMLVGIVSRGQLSPEPRTASANVPADAAAVPNAMVNGPAWIGFSRPAA